mgnify:FL=1
MRNNQDRIGVTAPTDNLQPNTEVPAPAASLEFIVPTEIVDLPSKGLFYEEGHPLHNRTTVEVKHMTTKEEDILTNQSFIKNGVAVERLLESVLVDPKMKTGDMLVGDKNALLVACRLYGYGNEYETKFTCPECGAAERHVFDLEDIESANFEENAKEYDITYNFDSQTMSMEIPRTKTKLELKILKSRELETPTNKKAKNAQNNKFISTHYEKIIVAVNGNSDRQYIKSYINSMSALDSRYLRTVYSKCTPAVDFTCSYVCGECGHNDEVEVPLNAEFFWPKS